MRLSIGPNGPPKPAQAQAPQSKGTSPERWANKVQPKTTASSQTAMNYIKNKHQWVVYRPQDDGGTIRNLSYADAKEIVVNSQKVKAVMDFELGGIDFTAYMVPNNSDWKRVYSNKDNTYEYLADDGEVSIYLDDIPFGTKLNQPKATSPEYGWQKPQTNTKPVATNQPKKARMPGGDYWSAPEDKPYKSPEPVKQNATKLTKKEIEDINIALTAGTAVGSGGSSISHGELDTLWRLLQDVDFDPHELDDKYSGMLWKALTNAAMFWKSNGDQEGFDNYLYIRHKLFNK
jgi:hypothetical protein